MIPLFRDGVKPSRAGAQGLEIAIKQYNFIVRARIVDVNSLISTIHSGLNCVRHQTDSFTGKE